MVEIRDFKNMSGLYLTELQAAGLYFERLPLEDDSIEAVRLAKEKGRILNDAEKQIVLDHFTQSREQVIEWVQKSGVPLNFPDGGHMETVGVTPSSTDGVKYPILVQQTEQTLKSTDTSGMQRLHAGVDDAGIGVHVVTHFFSGKITWYHKTTKGVARVEVWADDTSGWVVVYRGGNPHGACLHETKFLCQKTGPAEWKTVYPDMLNPFVDKPKWEFSLYNVYAFMFSPRTIVALLACMLIYGMIFQKLNKTLTISFLGLFRDRFWRNHLLIWCEIDQN